MLSLFQTVSGLLKKVSLKTSGFLEQATIELKRQQKRRSRQSLKPQCPVPSEIPKFVLDQAPCCFVLSTGRSGTKLLTKLLEPDIHLDVYHQPSPELIYPSKLAYEYQDQPEALRLAVLHSRYELVRASFLSGGIYVETNNRISFYAPALSQTFKKAKFIHLLRNPGTFVRSGLRRRYYQDHSADEGRIAPRSSDPLFEHWGELPQLAKISWLWNETNHYIEMFKQAFPDSLILTIKAEDLFRDPQTTMQIFEFLELEPPNREMIKKMLRIPVNQEHSDHISEYENWSAADKAVVKSYATLAQYYDYQL
jgi:hypothetical protein